MQKRLKPFPLLLFGVYPHRACRFHLSLSNPHRAETTMAVSAQQEIFQSLWFSSSLRWTKRGSSSLSRKKEKHYHQGQIAQYPNFSTFCSVKCMQHCSLDTGPVTLRHGLSFEDNATCQQLQSSCSGFTDYPGKSGQINPLCTYGVNVWGSSNELIGCNGQSERSQVHRTPATGGRTNSSRKSDSCFGKSRKKWHKKADESKQYFAGYAVNNTLPLEATAVVNGVEEATRGIFKDCSSYELFPFPISSSNLLVQQSAHNIIEEKAEQTSNTNESDASKGDLNKRLAKIYDKVLVVDNVTTAKQIVSTLTTKYKNLIHGCDTEVSRIDVKQDTPVDHGEIICFSIYSGPQAEFGNGKSYIWVDVLDGGHDVLMEFAPFFEDPTIKKVWHNYSFDSHIIENCGIQVSGFHADTMHLARLWDSSRKIDGGYSLEALSSDPYVMSRTESHSVDEFMGKISMKTVFGKRKVKKDGSEGKSIAMAPVEVLQREEHIPWVCYSVLDSISTLRLYESLKAKLEAMAWVFNGICRGSMYNFYEEYWRPFGSLLVDMEAAGLLVDRAYLSDVEKIAIAEQQAAAEKFRSWASKYCPDAKYMNVGSDSQIRQLFFGGTSNRKYSEQMLPDCRTFKVPNIENVIEDGKKKPSKYRNITLCSFGKEMHAEVHTASGWPSISGDSLKTFAGKISSDCIYMVDNGSKLETETEQNSLLQKPSDVTRVSRETPVYGTAYDAFGKGKEGEEACHAIAALCEVCSIDSLISNFILPLQDAFAAERRKAKMLNFSIAYGKTPQGLSRDWKVPLKEAKQTLKLWYQDRQEVSKWQEECKNHVLTKQCVHTLLGRARRFPSLKDASNAYKSHIERAAINTPVQGSAADVAMCAMLEINRNTRLKELGWKMLLQVHDEIILEGPTESSEIAKAIVVECMSKPFFGNNILNVDLAVDAKCAQNWYAAK